MPLSALDSHLGYWLRYVSNQVSHAFAIKLAARDVTVAEWVVLRDLFDVDTVTPSQLAEKLGLSRGAVSKLADRLHDKGFLTRAANPEDRRYQSLALTPVGRRLVPTLSALADRNDVEFFGHLSATDRAAIEVAMRDIVRRLGLHNLPADG